MKKNVFMFMLVACFMLQFNVGCNDSTVEERVDSQELDKTNVAEINQPVIIECGNGNSVQLTYYSNGLLEGYVLYSDSMDCSSESIFFAEDGSIEQIVIGESCQEERDSTSANYGTVMYSQKLFVKSDKGKIKEISSSDSSLVIQH